MIGVQMFLALAVAFPQFRQNLLHGRRPQIEPPEVCHYVRLKAAVHTSPLVTYETENP